MVLASKDGAVEADGLLAVLGGQRLGEVTMNVFAFPFWLLRNADIEAGNQSGTGWPAMLAGSLRR